MKRLETACESCQLLDAGGKQSSRVYRYSSPSISGEKPVLPRLREAKTNDELVELGKQFIKDNPKLVEGD